MRDVKIAKLNVEHQLRGYKQAGVTLIELIVFIVVISIALVALLDVYNKSVVNSVDPIVRVRLLEQAQSMLDEISSRKYDENTPTGGVPACSSAELNAPVCAGLGLDAGEDLSDPSTLDDVDDFHNYTDTPYPSYTRDVTVVLQATVGDVNLGVGEAKLITVTVSAANGEQLQLSTYRANF